MRARPTASLVAASLAVLGACGGSDDDAATNRSTVPAPTAPATPPATSPPTAAPTLAPTSPPTVASTTPPTLPSTTPPTTPPAIASTLPPTTPAASTTAPTGDRWQSPDGVFAVAFPGEPSEQLLDAPLPDGTTIPVTAYLTEIGDGGAAAIASCVVSSEGEVGDSTEVLEAARDGALVNVGAELVDSELIELQGRNGISYRGAIGEAGTVLARTYLDGFQLCQVLVVGEPAVVEDTGPPFLDSFEFLQEAA